MELAFLWIVLCIVIGAIGSTRRIGFGGAFFLSLFLSPIVGFIVTLFSQNVEEEKYKQQLLQTQQKQQQTLEQIKQQSNPNIIVSFADELERIKRLKDDGTITEEEFQNLKNKIINSISSDIPNKKEIKTSISQNSEEENYKQVTPQPKQQIIEPINLQKDNDRSKEDNSPLIFAILIILLLIVGGTIWYYFSANKSQNSATLNDTINYISGLLKKDDSLFTNKKYAIDIIVKEPGNNKYLLVDDKYKSNTIEKYFQVCKNSLGKIELINKNIRSESGDENTISSYYFDSLGTTIAIVDNTYSFVEHDSIVHKIVQVYFNNEGKIIYTKIQLKNLKGDSIKNFDAEDYSIYQTMPKNVTSFLSGDSIIPENIISESLRFFFLPKGELNVSYSSTGDMDTMNGFAMLVYETNLDTTFVENVSQFNGNVMGYSLSRYIIHDNEILLTGIKEESCLVPKKFYEYPVPIIYIKLPKKNEMENWNYYDENGEECMCSSKWVTMNFHDRKYKTIEVTRKENGDSGMTLEYYLKGFGFLMQTHVTNSELPLYIYKVYRQVHDENIKGFQADFSNE